MRVALMAYACEPGKGSEPGSGWGWARALADVGHDVTVLTRPKGKAAIRQRLDHDPHPGLLLEYVDIPGPARLLVRCTLGLRPGGWIAYVAWQRAALRRARQIHAVAPFDVAHHVTLASVVPGTSLVGLDVPVVFGPLGSGQRAPRRAARIFGTSWPKEALRSAVVSAPAMRLNPWARRSIRRAGVVLVTNDDTARLASRLGAGRVEVMCDTGVEPALLRPHAALDATRIRRVVWVGTLIPRKGLRLAIAAVGLARHRVPLELVIVGDGPMAGTVDEWCKSHGVATHVRRRGRMPWQEVQDLYDRADVLLFTSVRESFGAQVVEATAAGLPIVTLDLHGVASIVPHEAAAKVPFTGEASTAASLADALVDVLTDPARHARMSQAASRFAATVAWPARARAVSDLYRQLVGNRAHAGPAVAARQDRRGRVGSRR